MHLLRIADHHSGILQVSDPKLAKRFPAPQGKRQSGALCFHTLLLEDLAAACAALSLILRSGGEGGLP